MLRQVFGSGFRHGIEALFLPSWARFRTPCWVYVGSFLESFSLLRWGPLLKSFWHRFFIDFGLPWNIKNRAPVEARIKFFNFDTSYLKIVVDLDFGAQNAPKIEPKRLPKPFKNQFKIRVKLNVDFDRNLAQLGGQLGLNLGAQEASKTGKKGCWKRYPFRDANMTPTWPQNDTKIHPNMTPKWDKNCKQNDIQNETKTPR